MKLNSKDRDYIGEAVKNFSFDNNDDEQAPFVLIGGETGKGKTHLACTMSELMPVAICDTELRGRIVTRKFQEEKHPVMIKGVENYLDMLAFVNVAINEFKELGKKGKEELHGQCDSFVAETDVHYPTDINLLFDAIVKVITKISKITPSY